MKNKKSIFLIVAISLFVGFLHFVIGPNYQGIFSHFISGYLLHILLPCNLYLLLQLALRKHVSLKEARITGAILSFALGAIAEMLQFYGMEFLGSTFDPWDIFMYASGLGLGIAIDLLVMNKLEKQGPN